MTVVNLREKTINAKVVYYGPPLGGKTTSLKHVHRVMDPENKTNLVSLNTENDRTLFFDFLPINLGRIGDFSLKIQGFTVPGQVKYLLTRRYVLRGADAVVFVADSQPQERENNVASLVDLQENLRINGLPWDTIPMALEYNKRDASPLLSLADLDGDLNERGLPRFETIATVGDGVFETFIAVVATMVRNICTEYRIAGSDEAAEAVTATLQRIQEEYREFQQGAADAAAAAPPTPEEPAVPAEVASDSATEAAADVEERPAESHSATQGQSTVVVMDDAEITDPTLSAQELLEKAVGSNMQVAELLTEVQEARADLEARVDELSALYHVSSSAASVLDEEHVVASVVEGAATALHTGHASILLLNEDGTGLVERGHHGFAEDPLLAGCRASGDDGPLATLLRSPDGVIATSATHPEVLAAVRSQQPDIRAAVAAPLRVRNEAHGLLLVYFRGRGRDPSEATCRFLGTLAASAAVAIENAALHGRLERFNRELEQTVAERTEELRTAHADLEVAYRDLQQVDQLKDDFLSTMSHELMTPLSGIRSSAEILNSYPDMEDGERTEFLQGIEQEAHRLTDRLQDILDLSAFDAGQVSFRPKPAFARELVQAAIDRASSELERRSIAVTFWPQTGIPKVNCDARWVGRLLDHLIDNAVKFSPEGAQVVVTLESDGDAVRVGVRDRGPGIPEAARGKLFDRFKQVGDVLTDKAPGIGAGLPLVKRIADGHAGSIGIEGGPGQGTYIWVRIPFDASAADAPAGAPEA